MPILKRLDECETVSSLWMNVKLCLVFRWTMLCCACHTWFLASSW